MAEGRGTEFRWAGRADRRDASHSRGREALEFRKPLLACAQLLHAFPGPEAQKWATYIGWLMHRILGGLFIVPSVISIMALSYIYTISWQWDLYRGLLLWPEAAVLPIVVQAVVRVGKRALNNGRCNFWRPRHL
jgi:chromate transport protein ChrA